MLSARGLRHEWWLGGAACPFIIGHCWLRIVAEVSPGTFGIQVVPFGSGSILRAGRQRPIASAPLYPANGGVPVNVPFGILTWGQRAHYTCEILVFKEELLWLNSACSVTGR